MENKSPIASQGSVPNIDASEYDTSLLPIDPLYHEINLLRIEGFYFCFDPKATSIIKEKQTFIERLKSPDGFIDQPITIEPNPNYGRPGPLSYKILQAILKKYSEYYYPFPEYVPFTQRELARWVGRNSYGGHTQKQFYTALMQLRRTAIGCTFYNKKTKQWKHLDFQILSSVYLSGKEEKINECVIKLDSEIVKSLNNYHFLCLNHLRMEELTPIATALYKHLFYHFSNIRSQKKQNRFYYQKDYASICNTWLGGLTVHKYKSRIEERQLGFHFKLLRKAKLISKISIDRNIKKNGFNITFFPGRGFFQDYERFYTNKKQLMLDFRKAEDDYGTVKPMKLVCYFFQRLNDLEEFSDVMCCSQGDLDYARELLDTYQYETLEKLVDFSVNEAKKTKFEMQRFVAVKNYITSFFAKEKKRQEIALKKEKAIESEKEKNQKEKLLQEYHKFAKEEKQKIKSTLSNEEMEKIKERILTENPAARQFNLVDPFLDHYLQELACVPPFEQWIKTKTTFQLSH